MLEAAEDVLDTAVATARGGREGEVVSDDGVIDLMLAIPKEMGGPGGDASNPEQLFAAGYAACFHSALEPVAGREKVDVVGSSITAHVSLGADAAGFGIAVGLVGAFPTLIEAEGLDLMERRARCAPTRVPSGATSRSPGPWASW